MLTNTVRSFAGIKFVFASPFFNPFVTRKSQLSWIFANIQAENYRFSRISNPQRFLRYLFSCPRYWDNIGFNNFLTVYILYLNFFSFAVLTVFKEIILRNLNQFEFFWYLTLLERFLKNKYSFYNSAHHILDLSCTHFE